MFTAGSAAVNGTMLARSTFAHFLTRASRALLATLLPPTCCLCEAAGTAPDLDLCTVCHAGLPANASACVRCAVPLAALTPGAHAPCGNCLRRPPMFDLAFAPLLYAYPVDHCVQALKFRGERVYGRVLGMLLADARRRSDRPLPELVIPIPLHAARYRERGFNQAHDIARFAAARLGLPVETRCLERPVATGEQSALPLAGRRRNVRGAFRVARPVPARRVALVDDVLTTGSTASEAARVLKQAGVAQVEVWAAARVPN